MAAAAAALKAAKSAHHHPPSPAKVHPDVLKESLTTTLPETPRVGFWKYQREAEYFYNLTWMQVSVAGLIVANFIANIAQAQFDPKEDKEEFEVVWEVLELFFNVVFLFELLLNMYGTWLCRFWKSGWNIFDFSVVLIGWLFQLKIPLPKPMKLLRMMRAFRVFRLFKRIQSLKKIMVSLAKSIPGVMNAFLIQVIITSIFAIIAVDRFRDYGEGGSFTNEMGQVIEYKTPRGQDYGFEYFGDFGKSLYTMFQVLTGESWAEAVTRPLFNSNSATTSTGSAFFFVFYIILNGVVLINVVVAELLEKFVDDPLPPDDPDEHGNAPVDPVKETLEKAAEEVGEIGKQMSHLNQVTAAMKAQMMDVFVVREQVKALTSHLIKPPNGNWSLEKKDDSMVKPPVGFPSPLRVEEVDNKQDG